MHKKVLLEKIRRLYARIRGSRIQKENLLYEDIIVLIAKSLKPRVYVELGVYQCDVINRIIPYVRKNAYAVDVSGDSGLFLSKNPKAKFFKGSTVDFAKKLSNEGVVVDMIFIDADHKKESVIEDFNNFFPLVSDNGIIFLHDGYPRNKQQTEDGYCSNAWEAIDELTRAAGDTYEMMTLPQHPGLTLCRKRKKQVSWL